LKPQREPLQHGTGFVASGGRALFFGLALAPGTVLVTLAMLNGVPDLFAAFVIGLGLFLSIMLALLMAGRAFEYIRDEEWRTSPDTLPNAPLETRQWVIAFVAISSILFLIVGLAGGQHLGSLLLGVGWNAFATWLFAHFFAVKIIRFVRGLLNRGKQGL
jgi:hypothetical protein